ncbi:alanyl-tRNA editing protein Aarsd1-B [Leptinotarsa decemlineata]|uniref:alanyl-tRNA editing protein Aarsd1-B n=1 Tax=Leptinotarsa decemlineata TaxID=7539 RepID=UPI003D309308
MVFKCQEDSFLKEFTSKVVVCAKVKSTDNKSETPDCYEVILEDTILFPEGGGQPCDYGFLNNIPVRQVIRREDKAIHFIDKPLDIGATVKQTINWDRRFDHMQQHSGQHLLSAVLEKDLKITTVSWWLGEEVSYVELDIQQLSGNDIKRTEDVCNEYIREGRNVAVSIYSKDTPEEELAKVRSARDLPADHKGDIRVINIDGIDSNMCCGTHVTNLSQLQVVKLLHTEKSKRKDKILLHFLVGKRVINRLETCIDRERKLTALLNNHSSQHVELVEKLQKNVKTLNKNLQTVLKDLAALEASKLKSLQEQPRYFCMHRKEAEPDFMNSFIKEMGNTEIFLFLSTGDEKGVGNIVLYGNEKAVSELGKIICNLLDGKGAGKGNKFQAKVNKMVNRKEAEKSVSDYFKEN